MKSPATKAEFDEVASSMQQLSRNQLHALAREQKALQSDDRGDEQREEEEEQEEEDPCDIFAEFGTSPSQWLKAHPKAPEEERELVAMMDCPELEAAAKELDEAKLKRDEL